MVIDPSINVVVFKVKRFLWSKTIAKEADARSEDGIQQAWNGVQAENAVSPAKVLEIYSEWGPSAEDQKFLQSTFPQAQYSFSHERPENESDWDDAMERVAQQLLESMGLQMAGKSTSDDSKLLPVLRNHDEMSAIAVHQTLGAGLAVSLAYVAMTDRGTIGVDYVMQGSVESSDQEASMFKEAWENMREGLEIEGRQSKEGDKIISLSHPSDHAASAIGLPGFYQKACSLLNAEEVFVAIPDPGNLLLAPADSAAAGKLTEMVVNSEYWGAVALTPACFGLSASGIKRIAQRSDPND